VNKWFLQFCFSGFEVYTRLQQIAVETNAVRATGWYDLLVRNFELNLLMLNEY
jgi:hypothetical protein